MMTTAFLKKCDRCSRNCKIKIAIAITEEKTPTADYVRSFKNAVDRLFQDKLINVNG